MEAEVPLIPAESTEPVRPPVADKILGYVEESERPDIEEALRQSVVDCEQRLADLPLSATETTMTLLTLLAF